MKFKLLLIVILFFNFCFPLFTTAEDAPAKEKKSLLVGITLIHNYSFRSLSSTEMFEWIKTSRDEKETCKQTVTAGFNVSFEIRKNFSVESGIMYSSKGYKSNTGPLTFGDQIDPRYGFIYSASSANFGPVNNATFIYNYHYLDIPVSLNIKWGQKKCYLFVAPGLSANIPVATTTTVLGYFDDLRTYTHTSKSSNTMASFLSGTLKLGYACELDEKFNARIFPDAAYGITKAHDGPVSEKLWSAGIGFELMYRLR
jgi:hypothetical protein